MSNPNEYVRAVFCSYTPKVDGLTPEGYFDRWLAEVKAAAWDEGYEAGFADGGDNYGEGLWGQVANPYREGVGNE